MKWKKFKQGLTLVSMDEKGRKKLLMYALVSFPIAGQNTQYTQHIGGNDLFD